MLDGELQQCAQLLPLPASCLPGESLAAYLRISHHITNLNEQASPTGLKRESWLPRHDAKTAKADAEIEGLCRLLEKLQDNVTPCHPADLDTVFQQEFHQPLHALYAEFDQEPQAAASLAQVMPPALSYFIVQAILWAWFQLHNKRDCLDGRQPSKLDCLPLRVNLRSNAVQTNC